MDKALRLHLENQVYQIACRLDSKGVDVRKLLLRWRQGLLTVEITYDRLCQMEDAL